MGRHNQSFRENSSLAIILKVLTESDTQMSVKELTKLVLEKNNYLEKPPIEQLVQFYRDRNV